jgi:hypothetical protein
MSAPTVSVRRRDFIQRSRVWMKCSACGTTTIHCDVFDADIYERGFNEHVCRVSDIGERVHLRRMLRLMAGADDA